MWTTNFLRYTCTTFPTCCPLKWPRTTCHRQRIQKCSICSTDSIPNWPVPSPKSTLLRCCWFRYYICTKSDCHTNVDWINFFGHPHPPPTRAKFMKDKPLLITVTQASSSIWSVVLKSAFFRFNRSANLNNVPDLAFLRVVMFSLILIVCILLLSVITNRKIQALSPNFFFLLLPFWACGYPLPVSSVYKWASLPWLAIDFHTTLFQNFTHWLAMLLI